MVTIQYIAVALILAAAVGYASFRIHHTIAHAGDPCYGCAGCQLREIKRRNRRLKSKKPDCYQKKQ